MTLTQENIDNLTKLAAYLEGLPADYEHFDMLNFFNGNAESEINYFKGNKSVADCGTVACAVGHGPAAGVAIHPGNISAKGAVLWRGYMDQFCEDDFQMQEFLFSMLWEFIDNTHHGAAARIRYVLDGSKVPQGGPDKEMLELYQSYRVDKENNYG